MDGTASEPVLSPLPPAVWGSCEVAMGGASPAREGSETRLEGITGALPASGPREVGGWLWSEGEAGSVSSGGPASIGSSAIVSSPPGGRSVVSRTM